VFIVSEPLPGAGEVLSQLIARWSGPLIVLLQRAVRRPEIAYDVAAEALARARLEWPRADVPHAAEDLAGDLAGHSLAWLIGITAAVVREAAQAGVVPSLERRRAGEGAVRRLTTAHQQELVALTEHVVELPGAARAAAAALARDAPPPSMLLQLRASDLIDPEPLGEEVREHREP
jgi:hypothetical protein